MVKMKMWQRKDATVATGEGKRQTLVFTSVHYMVAKTLVLQVILKQGKTSRLPQAWSTLQNSADVRQLYFDKVWRTTWSTLALSLES